MSSRKSNPNSPSKPLRPPLNPHLRSVAAYPPGKPIEEVQREYGLSKVIKLASNENPLGPSPRATRAMAHAAGEMNLYPDGGGFYLRRAIAQKFGVEPEEVVLGAGSDEITSFLALAYLGPGRSIVTSQYSFVRYRMAADLMNARAKIVDMKRFRHDVAALAKACDRTTKLLFVDNPCNPTGAMMTRREMSRLLRAVPGRVLVVIDEAYYEFASGDPDYPDTIALRESHPNLIITRTFSKAYGLSGLRIGYAIAPARVAADLDRVRSPFNTSRVAQIAAAAALGDEAHLRRSAEVNAKGIEYLGGAFAKLGLKFVPTSGNFFLVDLRPRRATGANVYEELLKRGVIVRPMAGYGLPDHVRISIGRPGENRAVIKALREILG